MNYDLPSPEYIAAHSSAVETREYNGNYNPERYKARRDRFYKLGLNALGKPLRRKQPARSWPQLRGIKDRLAYRRAYYKLAGS